MLFSSLLIILIIITCVLHITFILKQNDNQILQNLLAFSFIVISIICMFLFSKGVLIGVIIFFLCMCCLFVLFYKSNNLLLLGHFYYNPFSLVVIFIGSCFTPLIVTSIVSQIRVISVKMTVKQRTSVFEFYAMRGANKNNKKHNTINNNNEEKLKENFVENKQDQNVQSDNQVIEIIENNESVKSKGYISSDIVSSNNENFKYEYKNYTLCEKLKNIAEFIFCYKPEESILFKAQIN